MNKYQDIRMEARRVVTEALQHSFQDVLPIMRFFPSVIYSSLLSPSGGGKGPFSIGKESSRGINDPSEHYSNKPARLNPCSPRLLRGPSSPSPAMHELSMIKYVLLGVPVS